MSECPPLGSTDLVCESAAACCSCRTNYIAHAELTSNCLLCAVINMVPSGLTELTLCRQRRTVAQSVVGQQLVHASAVGGGVAF